VGRRWGFSGRLVSLENGSLPWEIDGTIPVGDKVVTLRRVVSPRETLWLGTMMSPGIRCNTAGRG
jgi:hypothetical protein